MKNVFYFSIIIFSFIFASFLISCKKSEDQIPEVKDKLLIEEYTYDPNGLVIKIINDVGHAWNSKANLIQEIDSICIAKFHYSGFIDDDYSPSDSLFTKNFTWFSKKGQYACWKYKFSFAPTKTQLIQIAFLNPYDRHKLGNQFCLYRTLINCDTTTSFFGRQQPMIVFPIVNDTIVMRLSSIRPDMFKTYK